MIKKKDFKGNKYFWKSYREYKKAADDAAIRFEQIKDKYPEDHAIYRHLFNRRERTKEILQNFVNRYML